MTREENQGFSQAAKLGQDLPLMRRSRSLSELPGHLRVPILRRQGTERTQARLEAGAAGVEELRALRQQQQQIVDQTMAAVQKSKTKQKTTRRVQDFSDHQRLHFMDSRQQLHCRSFTALTAWHSASSLASISEERDVLGGISKLSHGNQNANVLGHSNLPLEVEQKRRQDLQHRGSPRKREPPAEIEASQRVSTEGAGDLGSNIGGQSTSPLTPEGQRRCRSASHDYTHISERENVGGVCSNFSINRYTRFSSVDGDQRRKHALSQCDQRFARGRSQSVHENFAYFLNPEKDAAEYNLPHGDKTENKSSETLPHPVKTTHNIQGASSQHLRHSKSDFLHQISKPDYHATRETSERHGVFVHKYSKPSSSLFHNTYSPLSPLSPSNIKSKSISWDNLLIAIGLQSENSFTGARDGKSPSEGGDDVIEPETDENSLKSENLEAPHFRNRDMDEKPVRRATRSQSFTCTASPQTHLGKNLFKGNSVKHNVSVKELTVGAHDDVFINTGQTQTAVDPLLSATLLRRASIQCEAVLTKSKSRPKIMNPLQDVDINSLRSPGPLHAVTLQYSSLSLRKLSEKDNSSCSLKFLSPPKESLSQSDNIHHALSPKNISSNLQSIPEDFQPFSSEDSDSFTQSTLPGDVGKILGNKKRSIDKVLPRATLESNAASLEPSLPSENCRQHTDSSVGSSSQRRVTQSCLRPASCTEPREHSPKEEQGGLSLNPATSDTSFSKTEEKSHSKNTDNKGIGLSSGRLTSRRGKDNSTGIKQLPADPIPALDIECNSIPTYSSKTNTCVKSVTGVDISVTVDVPCPHAEPLNKEALQRDGQKCETNIQKANHVQQKRTTEEARTSRGVKTMYPNTNNILDLLKTRGCSDEEQNIHVSAKQALRSSELSSKSLTGICEVPILSDDGYSTCDSISPKSPSVMAGHHSSDINSLSSESVGSINFLGEPPISHSRFKNASHMSTLSVTIKPFPAIRKSKAIITNGKSITSCYRSSTNNRISNVEIQLPCKTDEEYTNIQCNQLFENEENVTTSVDKSLLQLPIADDMDSFDPGVNDIQNTSANGEITASVKRGQQSSNQFPNPETLADLNVCTNDAKSHPTAAVDIISIANDVIVIPTNGKHGSSDKPSKPIPCDGNSPNLNGKQSEAQLCSHNKTDSNVTKIDCAALQLQEGNEALDKQPSPMPHTVSATPCYKPQETRPSFQTTQQMPHKPFRQTNL